VAGIQKKHPLKKNNLGGEFRRKKLFVTNGRGPALIENSGGKFLWRDESHKGKTEKEALGLAEKKGRPVKNAKKPQKGRMS